jgi:hypothetical protein
MSRAKGLLLLALGIGNLIVLATLGSLLIRGLRPPELPTPFVITAQPTDTPPTLEMSNPSQAPVESPQAASPTPETATPTEPPIAPIIAISTTCPITASGGLGSEIAASVARMPGPDSNGMVVPTEAQLNAWRELVTVLAQGDSTAACNLIAANGFPYQLVQFTDIRAANAVYWLLREVDPVTVGWGTYVIRASEVFTNVVVEAPHPVADWRTDPQGVKMFRALQAKALLVAGAHRCANQGFSPCGNKTMACGQLQPYRESDVAHATQTIFQASHQALVPCGGKTVALQLHGNGLATCPDLFISNGTLYPGGLTNKLFEAASRACGDFTVDVADGAAGECAFYGGGSVQGTYSNGCALAAKPDPCFSFPLYPSYPEQFLHLEQSLALREDDACLIEALRVVFRAELEP